jgi:DNA-binding transcriptional regulator YhcF (GntR family)
MQIDPTADRPVYKQLADLIRTQIKNGELKPGQRLPAQKDYMQEHWISRDTVDRAMHVLRNEGLIVTRRAGSRVRDLADQTIVPLPMGKVTARMPTEPERKKLGISEGVPILVIQRDGHDEEIHPADQIRIQIGDESASDEQPQHQRDDQPPQLTAPSDTAAPPAQEPPMAQTPAKPRKPQPRSPRRDPAIINQAVTRYKAGATLRALETEMRLSDTTIRKILHDQGVTMRPRGRRPQANSRHAPKPPNQTPDAAGTKPARDD